MGDMREIRESGFEVDPSGYESFRICEHPAYKKLSGSHPSEAMPQTFDA
uniref:Uncharacterized protein n=1 Tax=Candidatus Kentrum sp. MB TaxID=2138164 RepID=A0A450XZ83_9GAMM|nr:MAG: hypothetical protein BECKMB1821I_GA0114274_107610 [Candidatus Kentron sp. MB]